ncbi:DUF4352 domain-containing protein [Microbacterium jiangjiandongii]|uniref:DUF4352 domain-containing protein n=1 Tax=Microbacterium jiangjiandongii TaxID=3049071 RepID=UPI00214C2C97|nr:DUF4352 domain-containing protein [Microbacterium sp. zg.Y843]MCR2814324.1 DUF4352 domain-containing protein [Microbacterium sp. zg.Y843]
MSSPETYPAHPNPYLPPGPPAAPPGNKPLNVLGLVAVISAGVGLILACVPAVMVVGWVLLVVGFVLGIVSLFRPGRGKALGISALIVSVVGTIVGFIVFIVVVGFAFAGLASSAADDSSEVVIDVPAATQSSAAGPVGEGTIDNPLPLGTPIITEDWEVTVHGVAFDQTEAVMAVNPYGSPPAEGFQYILADVTMTYTGDAAEGMMPLWVGIAYITASGKTTETAAVDAPGEMDRLANLLPGDTATGAVVLLAPEVGAEDGVIAVRSGVTTDMVHVAVQ